MLPSSGLAVISVASAQRRADRVARARNRWPDVVGELVEDPTAGRTLAILGEFRVRVVTLGPALDDLG